jgi:predicted dienelactone hydrolase
MEGIGPYFKELDVLAPSFVLAMVVGYVVSKIYPATNNTNSLEK